MKTTGLYRDPTIYKRQKSDQTMRSALIKDRQGMNVNMDGASVIASANANISNSNKGGAGGFGGFLGGLSGTGAHGSGGNGGGVYMQNGAFQI